MLTYIRITDEKDSDIPRLTEALTSRDTSPFISINAENYWNYVTSEEGVSFYKVYDGGSLVAALQCERSGSTLYICITVLPEHRRRGIATEVVSRLQNGSLAEGIERITAYVDERNAPSSGLFQKTGFSVVKFPSGTPPAGTDGELIEFVYDRT